MEYRFGVYWKWFAPSLHKNAFQCQSVHKVLELMNPSARGLVFRKARAELAVEAAFVALNQKYGSDLHAGFIDQSCK